MAQTEEDFNCEMWVPEELDGDEGVYFNSRSLLGRKFVESCSRVASREAWYQAPWWLRQGDFMSFWQATREMESEVQYTRHEIKTFDGGVVVLDLAPAPSTNPETRSFVLLVPGGGSDEREPYIVSMVQALTGRNFAVGVVSLPGYGDCPVVTPRFFSLRRGSTDDLRSVVSYVRKKLLGGGPHALHACVSVIGWSVGASITINTLAEPGQENAWTVIDSAVAIGAPYDVDVAMSNLEENLMRRMTFNSGMANAAREAILEHEELFSNGPVPCYGGHSAEIDLEAVRAASVFRDIDEALTRRVCGYDSVEDYYEDSSPGGHLHKVRIPLLLIHAADDPISTGFVPFSDVRANSSLFLAYTANGGHVGWLDAQSPQESEWLQGVVGDFLTLSSRPGK